MLHDTLFYMCRYRYLGMSLYSSNCNPWEFVLP